MPGVFAVIANDLIWSNGSKVYYNNGLEIIRLSCQKQMIWKSQQERMEGSDLIPVE